MLANGRWDLIRRLKGKWEQRSSEIRSTLADNAGVMHKICSQPDSLTFPVRIDFHFFGLISGRRSAYPVIRRHFARCFHFNH